VLRNRSNQSPLPLSFPVEGKELGRFRQLASSLVGHQRSLKPNFQRRSRRTQRGRAATKTRNISRKGAKHVLSNVEGAAKKIKLPNLAFLASFRLRSRQAWREQIPVLGNHGPPESLRKPRKLSTIAIRRSDNEDGGEIGLTQLISILTSSNENG
jgi:hypothetical protein